MEIERKKKEYKNVRAVLLPTRDNSLGPKVNLQKMNFRLDPLSDYTSYILPCISFLWL